LLRRCTAQPQVMHGPTLMTPLTSGAWLLHCILDCHCDCNCKLLLRDPIGADVL
jgi:hypothetical protein